MKPLRSIPHNYYRNNLVIPFKEYKEKKAINKEQDWKILGIFASYPELSFSAWEIFDRCGELGYGYLITSIRRSVTTLKDAGYIIKTGQKMEREGSQNCLWQLKQT